MITAHQADGHLWLRSDEVIAALRYHASHVASRCDCPLHQAIASEFARVADQLDLNLIIGATAIKEHTERRKRRWWQR